MNIVAIVQARTGSTRLPGKVLRNIYIRSMLQCVVQRVQAMGLSVVVAVPFDDWLTIYQHLDESILNSFREFRMPSVVEGSEFDVLERFVKVSERYPAEAYVRFTADCPLLDVDVSKSVIAAFQTYGGHAITGTSPDMDGLDTEVFSYHALMEAHENATGADREHVTSWMKRELPYTEISMPRLGPIRWSVDDATGLDFVRRVYRACPDCAVGVPHHTNAGSSIGGADRSLVLDLHVGEGGGLRECLAAEILSERVGPQWRYASA